MILSKLRLFIVIGRTGHSLILSKALPFSTLGEVKDIYIFSETPGFVIPKAKYITIPSWIIKIKPRFLGKIFRIFFEPLQLLYFTIKLKPDLINGVYCLPKGLNSVIISKLTGTRCFNSIIGSKLEIETELPLRRFWECLNLWVLRRCDAITIKGKTDLDYLISRKIDSGKIFEFNGAVDLDKFKISSDDRTIDILFAGTFYELKGPDRFIKIINSLLPEFPDLKVSMIGNGKMWNESVEMVTSLHLDGNIRMEGYQRNTAAFFQKSKVLVMPSRSESISTAMLEAMSCGCVPVISKVGNVKEAAIANVNSKIIDNYNDLSGFAEAIRELLNDEEKRMEYAEKGRIMVEDKYSVGSQSLLAGKVVSYLIKS